MSVGFSDWISLFALFFAIVSFFWSWVNDRNLKKQQKTINEYEILKYRKEEEESKKAYIKVSSYNVDNKGKFKIAFKNTGKSTAKNIKVIDWGSADDEDSGIYLFDAEKLMPYSNLYVDDSFDIKGVKTEKVKPFSIIIEWDDDFKKGNRKEQLITLG